MTSALSPATSLAISAKIEKLATTFVLARALPCPNKTSDKNRDKIRISYSFLLDELCNFFENNPKGDAMRLKRNIAPATKIMAGPVGTSFK